MSPRQIDVHPEAAAEARAAAQWYRERSALAADAFLADSIMPSVELPRAMKCIRTMFGARDGISCSGPLSIWYIAKAPENLSLLLLPMVGEGQDIGKNV